MVPKMLSHPIEPLTFLFFTRVATTLVAGSVTAVSFARNFQSVPVALIGVAISLAAFPALSSVVGGRRPGRRSRRLVRTSAITITPDARSSPRSGSSSSAPLAIEVLLGGGEFDAEDVARDGDRARGVRARRSRSTPSATSLARGLYATHNTLLPLRGRRWPGSPSRS